MHLLLQAKRYGFVFPVGCCGGARFISCRCKVSAAKARGVEADNQSRDGLRLGGVLVVQPSRAAGAAADHALTFVHLEKVRDVASKYVGREGPENIKLCTVEICSALSRNRLVPPPRVSPPPARRRLS